MLDPSDAAELLQQLGKPYQPLRERFGRRHAELLEAIQGATRARVHAEPCGGARFAISVAAIDCVGVLAIITGLFAARGIDVRNGDVFTVRPKRPEVPSRIRRARARAHRPRRSAVVRTDARVLDVFEVVAPSGADAGFWQDFEKELGELVALLASGELATAVERVALGVSESLPETADVDEHLFSVSVSVDNEANDRSTELQIQSPDTPAFLFEFANALTLLDVNIERVEIRTLYGEVRDTFWVTDAHGRKIERPESIQELRVATALIKQFSHLLPGSANPAQALQQFTRFASEMLRRPDWTAALEPLGSSDVLRTLAEMMGVSRFLWEDFLRLQHENLFPVLSDAPGLESSRSREELEEELAPELEGLDGDEAARALNLFKDREMFRIDLRHITRRIGMDGFSVELTSLAEAIISSAAQLCLADVGERGGPMRSPWCICGAGKLGGRELGFASDIELIFVFDRTRDEDPAVFEAFVQRFLRVLAARQNGVFEIDLRLRPHGAKGPLASTLDAFLSYYAPGGQAHQFERMALVKLRPVAGDPALGKRILAGRDAFVYSGERFDRGNVEHLRKRQGEEIVRPGTVNAKFSPGGLVDVEYFVQALQIEKGVEHPKLRATGTLEAMEQLVEAGCLPLDHVARLAESYRFLRRLIDALRVVRGNAKDLAIPDPGSREFEYLARRLDYGSPDLLREDLERYMGVARELWW